METSLSPDERERLCALLEPIMHYAEAASRGAFRFPRLTEAQTALGDRLAFVVGEAIGVDWAADASVEVDDDRAFSLVVGLMRKLISTIKSEVQHVG